jgi:prepilin-type N-terminal cleavage/methylation domain-containing protein
MRSQRGFTLIELMVALVVSSLLVGMILAIFSRMSMAYRGQQQIAGVQQVLAAARATIELDAKQVGLEMPQGFKIAPSPGTAIAPLGVIDNSNGNGPDQLRLCYADPTTQAAVVGAPGWPGSGQLQVDSASGFLVGDLVVLSTVDASTPSPVNAAEANVATYDVCVLQITAIGAGSPAVLSFSTSAPWGAVGEPHCRPNPQTAPNTLSNPAQSMIYKFVAHAYKIDPARPAAGTLQQSPTGGLIGTVVTDAWADLAFGFTDIQIAVQVVNLAAADLDGDADTTRDWYSGPGMNNLAAVGVPVQMSISLVARTDRDVEGVATAATPSLTAANPNNNSTGNHASVALPAAADPALQGSKIYRFTTFQVDFRNLGVDR